MRFFRDDKSSHLNASVRFFRFKIKRRTNLIL